VTAVEPVISVDAKKKELVGNFKNNGRKRKNSSVILKTMAKHGRKKEKLMM
jgi:hypothetical protein